MRRFLPSIILIIALAVGAWIFWSRFYNTERDEPVISTEPPPQTFETAPKVGFLAPDFKHTTFEGTSLRLSDFLGQVVVVNFWESTCPFCASQLRTLNAAVAQNQGKVVVLAINRGEPPSVTREYLAGLENIGRLRFLEDPDNKLYDLYEGITMPQTYFIDGDGVVRAVVDGEMDFRTIRDNLKPLLED